MQTETAITAHPYVDLEGVSAETICRALVDVCLSREYAITIESGGDEPDLTDSTDPEAIWEAINAVEVCNLTARPAGLPRMAAVLWVMLIPANKDCVICDYNYTQTAVDIIHAAELKAVQPKEQTV